MVNFFFEKLLISPFNEEHFLLGLNLSTYFNLVSPLASYLKGFATFWEFSFYGQKKVADYEYHSLFAKKNSFSYLIFQF